MDAIFVKPRVELRRATPADARFISWVVLEAMDREHTEFASKPGLEAVLEKICKREDTLYSWKNTCIATYGGKVAGALIAYDGASYKETADLTFSLISKALDMDKPNPGTETEAGEYYLDSLAVAPEFRGHSIGSILIQNALEEAQALGFTKATLLVDSGKDYLQRLYGRLGFENGETVTFFGDEYIKMYQEI